MRNHVELNISPTTWVVWANNQFETIYFFLCLFGYFVWPTKLSH